VGTGYADHLSDADLGLLASASQAAASPARAEAGAGASWLRSHPGVLPELVGDAGVFQVVFGPDQAGSGAALASPFLIFAVAVHRAAAELQSMDHVPERSGQRQRVPVFDAPELREFLGSAARRLFLAELLGSFTRNASGPYRTAARTQAETRPAWVSRGGRGERGGRRFSELDLARMAGLLDAVPEAERAGVYRRLGDVALFLAGVFPDYAAAHSLGGASAARLLRAAQVPARQQDQLSAGPAIDLFEYLGARWYRAAWGLAPARTARLAVVAEVADRFRQARRVLNHIADRCLFPLGNPWFAPPAL